MVYRCDNWRIDGFDWLHDLARECQKMNLFGFPISEQCLLILGAALATIAARILLWKLPR